MILIECKKAYKPSTEEYDSSKLSEAQKHILSISLNAGVDLDSLKIFNVISGILDSEGIMVPSVIPHQIIETLIAEYSLNPRIAFKYEVENNMQELANLISLKNIDLNSKNAGEEQALLEMAVIKGNIEMVDLLIASGANQNIGLLSYIGAIDSLKFSVALRVVEKFQRQYDEKKAYNLLRAQGLSEVVAKDLIDYHNLLNDYLVSTNTKDASILNPLELRLLSDDAANETASEYQDVAFNNKYAYNPLHLAIFSRKFELAESMIRNGFDIYAKTHNNATPLQFLSRINEMEFMGYGDTPVKKFIKAIYNTLTTVDIELGNGETIADLLMRNPELASKVIELTQDELFYYFKKDADLFRPSKNPDKTYIAISHGDGFWSSGAWSLARNLIKNHPETSFYLVTDEMIAKGGDEFLKQFDAVINPGAGDSYPSHMLEFTKNDCPFSMNLELHYQNMLDKSYQLDIPYLGMCAGAQHFAMYHGGAIKPVKGYASNKDHQITFLKGTLAHFMTLTKDQQTQALQNCDLPDVSVKGDTAHNYAAVNNKLGLNMQLGAVSEENVVMAFAHENGIRYATQFHPEHHYTSITEDTNYEKAWIDNFINIANMHHEYRMNNDNHPTNYFHGMKNRLAECIKQPTCLAGEFKIESNGDNCLNYIDFV